MQCVNHPEAETRVSCSSCGDRICPDCMVYTPVGAKCPRCARMPKTARVTLKTDRLALAVIAGFGSAVVGGYLFGLAVSMVGFFSIIFAFLLGRGVGEAVSWGSGRYHATGLAVLASSCAALGVLLPFIIWGVGSHGFTLSAVNSLLAAGGIWKYIWVAAAAFGAWRRNA